MVGDEGQRLLELLVDVPDSVRLGGLCACRFDGLGSRNITWSRRRLLSKSERHIPRKDNGPRTCWGSTDFKLPQMPHSFSGYNTCEVNERL
jgi:hypothetical protein